MRSAALIFATAVALNYVWELGQSPLYVTDDHVGGVPLWHCLRAAGGDGLLVLVIFAGGALVTRRPDWYSRPGMAGYLWMLTAGLVIGVSLEWLAVHVLGRWAYEARMPVVPAFKVGLVPVLQMLVLPPLIFRVASVVERAILQRGV